MLESLRAQIYRLHVELVKNNLVVWTSGNVTRRDVATGLVVIKPGGVGYEELAPESPTSQGATVPGLGLCCLALGLSLENRLSIDKF